MLKYLPLLIMGLCPAHAGVEFSLGMASEAPVWGKSEKHESDGHFTGAVGVVEIRYRTSNIEVFGLHASSIVNDDQNGGVNLLGVRVTFGH